ncbi:hypothetical protein SAMN06295905_2648 [Devosia lucknowensis]|uniref:Uncharacterized protein n=1 Tax=Devosia lucknowensis TaxID=1096929 RepID=A0A1Y6G5A1_9HYPH|nr:hypothetical protein [Devosia lucknowensis]SMQ85371.1 hypothetical protein SAMN06295905_2648 [Devosia lucknowensis]
MMRQDIKALVWLAAGFTVWSVAFVLLYALQALGCAYGWPQHRLILIAAGMASLVPMAWLAWRRPAADGEPATTLAVAALWANRAALAAGVLALVLPLTFVSLCV